MLNDDAVRLPNAHLAAECASALGVISDWLLGLAERSETSADLLSTACDITDAERTPSDAQLLEWHKEAAGYKIRHVPATFPDMLKTEAVLQFEYALYRDKTPEQASNTMHETMAWLQAPRSDYEICLSTHMMSSLLEGTGYWKGLSVQARQEQAQHLIRYCYENYPSLRLYLCDYKKAYSSPLTVFGHLLAVVYVGRYYMVFREKRQVQALTEHFDSLVRDAEVDARSLSSKVEEISSSIWGS